MKAVRLALVLSTAAAAGFVALRPAVPHGSRSSRPIDALTRLPGAIGALESPPDDPENPSTAAKVELGRRLFFDPKLSGDETLSCSSCHLPEKGFADGERTAIGMGKQRLLRNAPTVLNAVYNPVQGWEGKFTRVDQQINAALAHPQVMDMGQEADLIARLDDVPQYRAMFQNAFGDGPTQQHIIQALAAYIGTLTTRNSPFDRYARGDKQALSDRQKSGLALFIGKAGCVQCHNGPNFTDSQFHSLGLPGDDPGRFRVTGLEADRGRFRTPTLRNISLTGPYMHDGSVSTLAEVMAIYDAGGGASPKSELLKPLNLTSQEKRDLIAFLESLSGTPRLWRN
jgi:cytochrome c peroxidase